MFGPILKGYLGQSRLIFYTLVGHPVLNEFWIIAVIPSGV